MQSTVPTAEIWKPVVGYEGSYEVSNHARVRSLDRTITASNGTFRRYKGQIIKQKMGDHYLAVGLSKNGETLRWNVHHLVCQAFHDRKPAGAVVRHLNGNPLDNRPENLRWGTPAENTADMMAHGNHFWTNKNHCLNGHEYTPENTFRNHRNARCCVICYRASRQKQNERKRKLTQERRSSRPCRVCGVTFVGFPSAVFCSTECKKASRRVAFKRSGSEENNDRRLAA